MLISLVQNFVACIWSIEKRIMCEFQLRIHRFSSIIFGNCVYRLPFTVYGLRFTVHSLQLTVFRFPFAAVEIIFACMHMRTIDYSCLPCYTDVWYMYMHMYMYIVHVYPIQSTHWPDPFELQPSPTSHSSIAFVQHQRIAWITITQQAMVNLGGAGS